ncbi:CCG-binding protein 1-like [Oryza glaberrima]|uniref:CCG-binding protein 1-like n=1 Tax=Oryza glaberrima TaxID=4538 RepID=UPI00224C24F5|nr:CCG-binding protein 1-like [Oryza glaberrima]
MLPPTATLLPLPLARAAPARLFFPAVSSRARGRVVRVGRHGAPEREAALSWRGAADESVNKEKHLVEHTKDRMSALFADYCTTLKGEECCSCWDAVEEFNKLEMELPRAELETVVKDAGGDMGHLISAIHRRAQARKTAAESLSSPGDDHSTKTKPYFPAPDELPKTAEELEGETEAAMPESTHTRLLRRMADHD